MRAQRAKTTFLACVGAAVAAATVSAPVSASSAPRTRPGTAVVDCTEKPQVRPGTFMLACGDGNNVLTSLRWSRWQPRVAEAEGRDMVNDCRPYCAAGHFHGYRVHVRLDQPQRRPGHPGQWHYTRITLTYPADRPAATPSVVTSRLWN
ncbi:hypothetical protein [Streptomyces endophytica]|uniref:Secreted protein n=1 Tax=Streptomyces endophytica TaxID=2991496 RepID=A0ABY6PJV5_9ACTN|nr:hypothetical protein [Streptomyces endophytica]UZJ33442.1 hypothetical protein OJ254_28170 [Streptomyces endophytica]